MVKELKRDIFFDKFLQKGSIDDLENPEVRKWVDKGYLAVVDNGRIYVTKGKNVNTA